MGEEFPPHLLKQRIVELEKDLAKLKRDHEELWQNEKEYRTMVENSLTGIYVDQEGKIVFANDRFAEIFGYDKNELISMKSREFVHPDDRDLTDRRREKRIKGEEAPSEYDTRGLTKDGELIWIRRRNTNIEYRGGPAILGNIVDITEQKQVKEELGRVNEEIRDFTRAVAHDLKTPIIAIHGLSEKLINKYGTGLDEKAEKYLDHIMNSADRIYSLVNDLHALVKGGEITAEPEDVSSSDVIEEVVNDLHIKEKDENLDLVVDNNLPVIRCDKEMIYQVFKNLVENAVKYAGQNKNPRIEIGYEARPDFHQFHVSDNGMGIDPEDQKKIFKKFHRVHGGADEEGSGLGLMIVERIIRAHGGQVWVKSTRGQGSTFYFTLPEKFREAKAVSFTESADSNH